MTEAGCYRRLATLIALLAIPLIGVGNELRLNLLSDEAKACLGRAEQDSSAGRFRASLARLNALLLGATVRVSIDYSTLPSGAKKFSEGVGKGVQMWSQCLSDSPFVFSNDRSPDVTVRFVDKVPLNGDLQGLLEARQEYEWSNNAQSSKLTATIYIVATTEGRLLNSDQVSQVVAHELGHLLGLRDSDNGHEIMGLFDPRNPCISPSSREVSAVKEFRAHVKNEIERIQRLL